MSLKRRAHVAFGAKTTSWYFHYSIEGQNSQLFFKKGIFYSIFIFHPYDCPNVRAISTSYIDNEKITQALRAYVNSIAYLIGFFESLF